MLDSDVQCFKTENVFMVLYFHLFVNSSKLTFLVLNGLSICRLAIAVDGRENKRASWLFDQT